MDSAARDFPPGDFRVSDADRDRAVAELGEAFRVGRLTADEFDERAGQALGARTGKELTALLADLPVDRAPAITSAAGRGLSVLSARRVVMVSSALAAATCAAIAAMNALSSSATVRQAVSVHTAVAQGGVVIAQGGGGGPICPAASGSTCVELIKEMAARHGQIPLPVPPGSVSVSVSTVSASPGFDWVGTVAPAAIAVLLVVLIIFMRVTRARHA